MTAISNCYSHTPTTRLVHQLVTTAEQGWALLKIQQQSTSGDPRDSRNSTKIVENSTPNSRSFIPMQLIQFLLVSNCSEPEQSCRLSENQVFARQDVSGRAHIILI